MFAMAPCNRACRIDGVPRLKEPSQIVRRGSWTRQNNDWDQSEIVR
jgi:hypothetical protein